PASSDSKADEIVNGSVKPGFLIDELLLSSVKGETPPSDDASDSMTDFTPTHSLPFPSGVPLNQLLLQSGLLSGGVNPQVNLLALAHLQQFMSMQQMQQLQGLGAVADNHSSGNLI
ncbi:hypothetical protein PMAYCL1PPCAC_31879, partial [Pristionchus mayeri]